MPKTKANTRPANRSQKREAAKRKETSKRATAAGIGKAQFEMNQHSTPFQAAIGRRKVGRWADQDEAKRLQLRKAFLK